MKKREWIWPRAPTEADELRIQLAEYLRDLAHEIAVGDIDFLAGDRITITIAREAS